MNLSEISVAELQRELLKREQYKAVKTPGDILKHVEQYRDKEQEYIFVVLLDGAHNVISVEEITKGIANRALAHPREVFRPAIVKNAVAMILGHNHPSGGLVPSEEDNALTDRMVKAGKIIGIPVLDHVIVSTQGYYSFLDQGKI